MKSLNKKILIEKSIHSRNASHFLKLANQEANQKYFKELQPAPLMEIREVKTEKMKAGLWNFIKSNVLELRP